MTEHIDMRALMAAQDRELENSATSVGISNGYDHANFVTAYGGDLEQVTNVPDRFHSVASYYLSGWAEGLERFENDQYEDA